MCRARRVNSGGQRDRSLCFLRLSHGAACGPEGMYAQATESYWPGHSLRSAWLMSCPMTEGKSSSLVARVSYYVPRVGLCSNAATVCAGPLRCQRARSESAGRATCVGSPMQNGPTLAGSWITVTVSALAEPGVIIFTNTSNLYLIVRRSFALFASH